MRTIELKLQEVWGVNAPAFCKECGVPAVLSRCGHDAAPWSELSPRQRVRVRLQAIRKVKADRLTQTVFTAAS